jgi:hypothetical protein
VSGDPEFDVLESTPDDEQQASWLWLSANKFWCGFKAIVTSELIFKTETRKVNLNAS